QAEPHAGGPPWWLRTSVYNTRRTLSTNPAPFGEGRARARAEIRESRPARPNGADGGLQRGGGGNAACTWAPQRTREKCGPTTRTAIWCAAICWRWPTAWAATTPAKWPAKRFWRC